MKLKDDDYILEDGAAWFQVEGFAIRIFHTGDGVRVSVCENGKEYDTLGEVFVFDSELEAEQ